MPTENVLIYSNSFNGKIHITTSGRIDPTNDRYAHSTKMEASVTNTY